MNKIMARGKGGGLYEAFIPSLLGNKVSFPRIMKQPFTLRVPSMNQIVRQKLVLDELFECSNRFTFYVYISEQVNF